MIRRHFLMSAAARPLAFAASDTLRVACVGLRGRGRDHMEAFTSLPGVEVPALCDVDATVLLRAAAYFEARTGSRPQLYSDLRKLLEDRSIDAVALATPDHWHTLQTIWCCQAGKDVLVEKPCSHNMFEARQIVAAARRYERIVAHCSQSRSSPALREAVEHLRSGLLGGVYLARGLCFNWRETIGRAPVEPVPADVDYNLWLGPAPSGPFTRNRFHYNWHWLWDFGSGELGNQGIHQLDIARWGLGVRYPSKVSAIGGHFMFDDDQQTPNTLNATYEFGEAGGKKVLVFEVRHWISNHEAGISAKRGGPGRVYPNTIGNLFYGPKGYLAIDGYGSYSTWLGKEQQPGPSRSESGDHFANFVAAVRSRKRAALSAEIEEGAVSTTLIHLANISYRLGRTLHFDGQSYRCPGDPEANAMFTRDYRAPFEVPAIS